MALCECGCGQTVAIAPHAIKAYGHKKGDPKRFVQGHASRRPLEERYREEDRGYETPCWIWQMTITKYGYGVFYYDNKKWRAHRYFYTVFKGPIPDGLVIDHLCRVRECVNPNHLEAVTTRENTLRSDNFIAVHARKTHCIRGHPFGEANTRMTPKGRDCRTCARMRARARRAKAREEA